MEDLPPIYVAHLLRPVEAKLIELLRSLTAEEWHLQTISPRWKVKDVAAHLLDTHLRKLSLVRDGFAADAPEIGSAFDLVQFINRLNEEGVRMYGRLSPAVLIAMMELASEQSCRYHESLDPAAQALFAVSWAGENASANWFDTARELTERWHHQQQIRLAVSRPGIMTPELYHPVLDTFMRALPFSYRNVACWPGAYAQFTVTGECGGSWYLLHEDRAWRLVASPQGQKISETAIPQEIAWRIFTKGIDREVAAEQVTVEGDRAIGAHILSTLAIVG